MSQNEEHGNEVKDTTFDTQHLSDYTPVDGRKAKVLKLWQYMGKVVILVKIDQILYSIRYNLPLIED